MFYERLSRDGWLTVPKIVVERVGIRLGDVVQVTLYAEKSTGKYFRNHL